MNENKLMKTFQLNDSPVYEICDEQARTDIETLSDSIPTKTSELTNDSGFLTSHQDISGKADKSTTLAGYGITDGATTSYVDNKIGNIESVLDAILGV